MNKEKKELIKLILIARHISWWIRIIFDCNKNYANELHHQDGV